MNNILDIVRRLAKIETETTIDKQKELVLRFVNTDMTYEEFEKKTQELGKDFISQTKEELIKAGKYEHEKHHKQVYEDTNIESMFVRDRSGEYYATVPTNFSSFAAGKSKQEIKEFMIKVAMAPYEQDKNNEGALGDLVLVEILKGERKSLPTKEEVEKLRIKYFPIPAS